MKKVNERIILLLICGILFMENWYVITMVYFDQVQPKTVVNDTLQNEIPVLMYHHLLPKEDCVGLFAENNIVVSTERFCRDMEQLKQMGYQTITLRQLEAFVRKEESFPGKYVVITFDDGYLSNKKYAQPVLEKLGYTAVIFVLTGWIEEHPQQFSENGLQYLSWPEIKEMKQTFQFASHTDNLHDLSWGGKGKMTTASTQDVLADLKRSIQKLQGTSYFSYPYGHHTEKTREELEMLGMHLAFTVNPVSVHAGDDPLTLGRWDMYQYTLEEVLGR